MVILIVIITFIGIAIGRLPVLRMNRATIALVGAVLVVLVGRTSVRDAFANLDIGTLSLLFAVMIISVNLSFCGFFDLIAYRITRHARSERQLLALVIASSSGLSAIFLNDTICLMLTPLVLSICTSNGLRPSPYLIAIAVSANIGSAVTPIGNPQNVLIGAVSGIPFFDFVARMIVPAAVCLVLAWVVIVLVFRGQLAWGPLPPVSSRPPRIYRPLLIKSVISVAIMLVGIIAGLSTTLAALSAASFLLVTRRIKPERVLRDVDWTLLVFFGSLFILTGSIRAIGSYHEVLSRSSGLISGHPALFSAFSVLLSNLISNVPAVMLLRSVVEGFANPHPWWLLLSIATTFAGNLTLLGSVANLIVAEAARKRGITLSFAEYLKVGVIVTVVSVSVGTTWLVLTTAL